MAAIQRLQLPRRGLAVAPLTTTVNPRRLIGLFLVLCSLVGGFWTISRADRRVDVIALTHDVASGQKLNPSDLRLIRAAVPQALYATSTEQLLGQAVATDMKAGELVPLSHVSLAEDVRYLAIPFKVINLPSLHSGERVDLWAGLTKVAAGLAISDITKESTSMVITFAVPPAAVASLISALGSDLVLTKVN